MFHPPALVSALLPDRVAAAGQAELRPQAVDAIDHRLVHADLAAPFPLRLRRPLVGGIQAALRAEALPGRGEVEVVDRRPPEQRDVARRVHLGPGSPTALLPIPRRPLLGPPRGPFGN